MEKELSPDERSFWHEQAAYWEVKREDAQRAVDYATEQRLNALEKLGMVRRIGRKAIDDTEHGEA